MYSPLSQEVSGCCKRSLVTALPGRGCAPGVPQSCELHDKVNHERTSQHTQAPTPASVSQRVLGTPAVQHLRFCAQMLAFLKPGRVMNGTMIFEQRTWSVAMKLRPPAAGDAHPDVLLRLLLLLEAMHRALPELSTGESAAVKFSDPCCCDHSSRKRLWPKT